MSEQQFPQQGHTPENSGVKPPPRLLLWVVIGLFVMVIVGSVAAVFVFREVLVPGQQQRVIDQLPFMRALLPPTPVGGALPTAMPAESDISPEDLLADPSSTAAPTDAGPTDEARNIAQPQLIAYRPSSPVDVQQVTTVSVPNLPASARMFGFSHTKQSWNNCGPANVTMALSYYGWTRDQSFAAQYLKPDREDKNVNPGELVSFVNEYSDLRAITRMGGDLTLLKQLVAAQFPVIIETGYMPEGYDWIGHYQTVVAYDDLTDSVYLYDSYLGAGANGEGLAESYADVDENWKHFNRTFIVIYEPSRENEIRQILGELADPLLAAENALEVAREEARANPRDVFAWFNIGTSLTRLGRYDEAAVAYDQARREGALPWRITWYQFGPFEAYFETGRYDDVMALVDVNLTNGAQYVEETHFWQGQVLQARGDFQGARASFGRALQHNHRYAEAREALDNLNA